MIQSVISNRFKTFADMECKGVSALYGQLARDVARDAELLDMCTNAREGQPIPNLFLGAVHYLLLQGYEHELKHFYGSMVSFPKEAKDSFPYFKDFCLRNKDSIISILKSKVVQTNEVRRCGYLYPCFCLIYEKVKKPLALIEIGTSAGLQLLWDTYSYSYGTGRTFGNQNSNVHIKATVKGNVSPFLLADSPPVIYRTGLDLHINDLGDPDDYLWLKALIWPNHLERRELFDEAAKEVTQHSPDLVEGDGVSLLPDIASRIPEEAAVCVFHTHVANQLPQEVKTTLLENIQMIGQKRDIFHLYNNMQDRNLHLDYYRDGGEYTNTVGETDGHGSWFSWNLTSNDFLR